MGININRQIGYLDVPPANTPLGDVVNPLEFVIVEPGVYLQLDDLYFRQSEGEYPVIERGQTFPIAPVSTDFACLQRLSTPCGTTIYRPVCVFVSNRAWAKITPQLGGDDPDRRALIDVAASDVLVPARDHICKRRPLQPGDALRVFGSPRGGGVANGSVVRVDREWVGEGDRGSLYRLVIGKPGSGGVWEEPGPIASPAILLPAGWREPSFRRTSSPGARLADLLRGR